MYYTLSAQPPLEPHLADAIRAIRTAYDPTAGFTNPHITVLFPVPGRVGEEPLVAHIESVLRGRAPFELELLGFHRSRDHWLFLTFGAGNEELIALYRSLYSGLLAEFRREDIEYVPHISLGHFLKPGVSYDWSRPSASDLDQPRFEAAFRQANSLPLPARVRIDSFHFSRLPDNLIDWATGKRASLPEDPQIVELRTFQL